MMKIKFIKIGRNGIVSWKKKTIKKKILLPEYTIARFPNFKDFSLQLNRQFRLLRVYNYLTAKFHSIISEISFVSRPFEN